MKGHITKKILISFFQGATSREKTNAIAEHIDTCPACNKNLDVLKQITSPEHNKQLKPDKNVLSNISSYYDKYAALRNTPESKQPASLWLPRLRLAGAAVLLVCAGLLLYAVSWYFQFENAPMKAFRVKGLVTVDKNNLHKGQPLNPGVILTTGDNSKLAIIYGNIVKLNAGPDTRIYIRKSRIDKKSGKIYFEIVVDKGVIMAEFDKSGNLSYTLKTPHGAVSSDGSTIAMEVDSKKTRVIIKEGSANLSSTHGRSVNSEEGYGYTITNKGVTPAEDIADEEHDGGSKLQDSALKDLMDDDPDDDVSVQ